MLARIATTLRPAAQATASRWAKPMSTGVRALHLTPLNALHKELGGKMVDFCGYELPVQYSSEGITDSHRFVRTKSGLFDVSHMGQLRITGKDRQDFVESIVVADVKEMPVGHCSLSLIINENGGILDDCVVQQQEDHIYWVINAGRKHVDLPHILGREAEWKKKGKDVKVTEITDHALVALQGPAAAGILQKYVKEDLTKMDFMTGKSMAVNGVPCHVTRCGYTGEDGFEISIPEKKSVDMFKLFVSNEDCHPAALGARDSLRLEAGLCLYGNDLDDTVTPAEGVLIWTIGKRQRVEGNFTAADKVLGQWKAKSAQRKRVGLEILSGAPARHGAVIQSKDGKDIGVVTSGTIGPSVGKAIAMAYVDIPNSKNDTLVDIVVRGKKSAAKVCKMPFHPTNYYKAPK